MWVDSLDTFPAGDLSIKMKILFLIALMTWDGSYKRDLSSNMHVVGMPSPLANLAKFEPRSEITSITILNQQNESVLLAHRVYTSKTFFNLFIVTVAVS